MTKYQMREHFTPDWKEAYPIPQLAELLEQWPDKIITITDNGSDRPIDWRLKPRDTELVAAIHDAIRYWTYDKDKANAVYDLLEEMDLV